MKSRSLRVRLALWHAGMLALALGILAALTLSLLREFLHRRADAALYDYADKTARSIANDLYQSSLPGQVPPDHFLNRELQEWGRNIQIVDQNGNVKEKSKGLADTKVTISLDARVNGMKGLPTFETRTDLLEHPVRIVTVPVEMGAKTPYLVQTMASLEGIDDALGRTALILAVLTPTVFVISLFASILVGRSLKTVDEITQAALAIEHTNLDRRIVPPGTDDEISRLASAFNEMIARLDLSFRQIQQFSADASHELKTPLTAIRGEAEVALMGERTSEEYRSALKSIVDEVERMSAIVENLLLLARADAEQIQVRRERVPMHELVLDVYEQMEGFARRKQIRLNVGEIDEAEVNGDPLWLRQILTNLCNNAVKYTPEGGMVTIALTFDGGDWNGNVDEGESGRGGDKDKRGRGIRSKPTTDNHQPSSINHQPFARVSVSDTGHGIPPEHLPHIFDRFYRADAGRSRDAGGVGLGLNIAKWAAESHGGRIEVQSEVGKGSTFTLVLPASTGKVDGDVDASSPISAGRDRA